MKQKLILTFCILAFLAASALSYQVGGSTGFHATLSPEEAEDYFYDNINAGPDQRGAGPGGFGPGGFGGSDDSISEDQERNNDGDDNSGGSMNNQGMPDQGEVPPEGAPPEGAQVNATETQPQPTTEQQAPGTEQPGAPGTPPEGQQYMNPGQGGYPQGYQGQGGFQGGYGGYGNRRYPISDFDQGYVYDQQPPSGYGAGYGYGYPSGGGGGYGYGYPIRRSPYRGLPPRAPPYVVPMPYHIRRCKFWVVDRLGRYRCVPAYYR